MLQRKTLLWHSVLNKKLKEGAFGIFLFNNMADIITLTRIAGSIALAHLTPFSLPFYLIYIWCGLSDILDGFTARLIGNSRYGAFLDSTADIIFLVACTVKMLPEIRLNLYIPILCISVGISKIILYILSYRKKKNFEIFHNIPNKITGVMLFIFPLTTKLLPVRYSSSTVLLCAVIANILEWISYKNLSRDKH